MDTLTKTKRKKRPIYTQKVMSKTETGGENGTEVQKIIRGRSKTQAQTQETAVLKIIQEINPSKLRDKYNVACLSWTQRLGRLRRLFIRFL